MQFLTETYSISKITYTVATVVCDVKEKRKPFGLPLIKNSQDQNKTPTSLIFA